MLIIVLFQFELIFQHLSRFYLLKALDSCHKAQIFKPLAIVDFIQFDRFTL